MTGTSDTTITAPLPRIPGYELSRLLAEGGMGQVFLGHDVRLKRQVAVKTMSATLGEEAQFRQRFAHEAQIVAGFRHPNIVTVFAYGEADGRHYIVMEYVPGGTLADRLAAGRLAESEVQRIGGALARALGYFHENGIVHRDLKPGNILFTAAGDPVLSDFGIAKSQSVDSTRTRTGFVIGSPKYMAPEQLAGTAVTDRSDVFSFGLVLLEMSAGVLPPREVTTIRTGRDVVHLRNALPPSARRLAPLLARCLRLEPDERPSAAQCARELDALVSGGRRGWVVGAGVLVVAVVAALFVWQRIDAPLAPPPALPTYEEFVAVTTRPEESASEIVYPPYRTLLELRARFNSGGATAIAADLERLRERAAARDGDAQVTLFLAADAGLIEDTNGELAAGLRQASDAGNALATYYLALGLRQQLDTEGGLDRASLIKIRDLFAKAARQGLSFANDAVREANGLLDRPPG